MVTEEGDTLDCRQWQRVIAVPGKVMLRSDSYYNVTRKLDIYPLDRDGATLEYDGMELQKVARPTVECADYLSKTRWRVNYRSRFVPGKRQRHPALFLQRILNNPHADASPLQVKVPSPSAAVVTVSSRLPRKSRHVLLP